MFVCVIVREWTNVFDWELLTRPSFLLLLLLSAPKKKIEMYVLLIGKFLRIHHYTVCQRVLCAHTHTRTQFDFMRQNSVIISYVLIFTAHSMPIPHNTSYTSLCVSSLLSRSRSLGSSSFIVIFFWLFCLFAHLFAHCFDCTSIRTERTRNRLSFILNI